jgi:RNA polymerase sigma factor (sigma-70 family)
MLDDAQLLRRYADEKSEAAFAELVRRHLDLVYSAALRQVEGDVHRAKDVAQQVFTLLAQKAGALARHPALTGWLYLSARHCAARAMRREWRRQALERKAADMSEPGADAAVEWERARPVLDAAMEELGATDREAVLLRYFARRPFAQIGVALRLSEDGARRRVERALDKLRAQLARRGVTSSAAALAAALEGHAVLAAPASLTVSVTGAAMAGSAGGGVAAVFMNMTKLQVGLGAAAALGAGVFLYQLKANSEAQAQLAARRPAERRESVDSTGKSAPARERSAPGSAQPAAPTMAPASAPPRAAPASATPARMLLVNLPDADLSLVFRTYEGYAGQRVTRGPEVDRVRTPIHIVAGPLPREEMLEAMRRALREQAGILIESAADGTIHARIVR